MNLKKESISLQWNNKWRKEGKKEEGLSFMLELLAFLHSNCHNKIWFQQESQMDAKDNVLEVEERYLHNLKGSTNNFIINYKEKTGIFTVEKFSDPLNQEFKINIINNVTNQHCRSCIKIHQGHRPRQHSYQNDITSN